MKKKIIVIFFTAIFAGSYYNGILSNATTCNCQSTEDNLPDKESLINNLYSTNNEDTTYLKDNYNFNQKRCIYGPCKFYSYGKGFHFGRLLKIFRIDALTPIKIFPLLASKNKRPVVNMWMVLCYHFGENAQTKIEPLFSDKTIYINGSHLLITGLIKFPIDFVLQWRILYFECLNKTIRKIPILNYLINTINKYDGKFFWYWHNLSFGERGYWKKTFFWNNMIRLWFMLPLPFVFQFMGLIKPLDFGGYTPFLIAIKLFD